MLRNRAPHLSIISRFILRQRTLIQATHRQSARRPVNNTPFNLNLMRHHVYLACRRVQVYAIIQVRTSASTRTRESLNTISIRQLLRSNRRHTHSSLHILRASRILNSRRRLIAARPHGTVAQTGHPHRPLNRTSRRIITSNIARNIISPLRRISIRRRSHSVPAPLHHHYRHPLSRLPNRTSVKRPNRKVIANRVIRSTLYLPLKNSISRNGNMTHNTLASIRSLTSQNSRHTQPIIPKRSSLKRVLTLPNENRSSARPYQALPSSIKQMMPNPQP